MTDTIQPHLDRARHDRTRVLIVGAGMAGLTLAQLLRRDGLHPVLVERAASHQTSGYMLALMPLVDPVINGLGLRDSYLARTANLGRYVIRTHTGAVNREYQLARLFDEFGDYRGISRGDLLDLLGASTGVISYDTTVAALAPSAENGPVKVTLSRGGVRTDAEFDLVVVADGLHSSTRKLVAPHARIDRVDTKWGGWVAWAKPAVGAEELGEELWGAGSFLGIYPVKDRLGVIVAGPHTETAIGPARFVEKLRGELKNLDARLDTALSAITDADDPYYWSLTDCRVDRWAYGRVALIGDAAVGFLPTAGIGACMAMESAWVLSERLREVANERIPAALTEFERFQRPRVEAAQKNSRQLATLMFNRSRPLAVVRDAASHFLPLQTALRPIRNLLKTAPVQPEFHDSP